MGRMLALILQMFTMPATQQGARELHLTGTPNRNKKLNRIKPVCYNYKNKGLLRMSGNVFESSISINTLRIPIDRYVLELLLRKNEPAKVVKRGIIR